MSSTETSKMVSEPIPKKLSSNSTSVQALTVNKKKITTTLTIKEDSTKENNNNNNKNIEKKHQQSKIPTSIKRKNNLITATPSSKAEKSTGLEPSTPGKPVAKNTKLSTDEELLSRVNKVDKAMKDFLAVPSTEKKNKNNRLELKFATEAKFDPKCATGIPWIVSKKVTKVKPFNFAGEELAKLRASKAKK